MLEYDVYSVTTTRLPLFKRSLSNDHGARPRVSARRGMGISPPQMTQGGISPLKLDFFGKFSCFENLINLKVNLRHLEA
jgi:hypothetical protein